MENLAVRPTVTRWCIYVVGVVAAAAAAAVAPCSAAEGSVAAVHTVDPTYLVEDWAILEALMDDATVAVAVVAAGVVVAEEASWDCFEASVPVLEAVEIQEAVLVEAAEVDLAVKKDACFALSREQSKDHRHIPGEFHWSGVFEVVHVGQARSDTLTWVIRQTWIDPSHVVGSSWGPGPGREHHVT